MINKNQPKIGDQKPRYRIAPKYNYTDGEDASILAGAYGLEPDLWQKDILNVVLGRNVNDEFTTTTMGLSVPRQNGKNALLEMIELYHLCTGTHSILHTAHEVKTARKSFLRLVSFFTNYDDLADICKCIRYANGQESIVCEWETEDGIMTSSIEFSARSKGAARGFSVTMLVCDEAQELTSEQMEALMPTLSAAKKGQRQIFLTGTPPYPNCRGDVFRNTRSNAINKENKHKNGLCWFEWSVDEPKNPHEPKWWYKTNPALGIRLTEEFTESEANSLSPDGFNRERLGFWDANAEGEDHPINSVNWRLCKTDNPPKALGIICYGVKFSFDGHMAALSVCNKLDDEKAYVELLEYKSVMNGMQWLLDYLVPAFDKTSQIMLDGNVNTDTLTDKLIALDAPKSMIMNAKTNGMLYACSTFANAVREHEITHSDQNVLTPSAINCVKRPIGSKGGWGFASFLDGVAEVIESAALAYFACTKTKRDPSRDGGFF